MELVYLWVDEHKNITDKGFLFSPGYQCEFVNGSANCKKQKEYISDFFGENIKITAIVGENGTGKSAILERLGQKKYRYYLNDHGIITDDLDVLTVYVAPENFNGQSHNVEILNLANEAKRNTFFQQSFLPNALYIDLNYEFNIDILYNLNFAYLADRSIGDYNEFTQHDISDINKQFNELIIDSIGAIHKQKDFSNYIYCKYFIQKISMVTKEELEIGLKELVLVSEPDDYEEIATEIGDYIELLVNVFIDRNRYTENFEQEIYEVVKKHHKNLSDVISYFNALSFKKIGKPHEVYIEINDNNYEHLKNLFQNEEVKNILYMHFLKITDNKKIWFRNLSKGEQDFLKLFAIIYHELSKDETNALVLLDEVIVYWHPKWQKAFVNNLISFYQKVIQDKKIHTIITTHSPFILSDLPKEHIILLDKDDNGNCLVVDELKDRKQTFGANIHTLLSDSFFMNGLMGDFASTKIDEIINILNQDMLQESEKKYCSKIISLIGEPIIKNQLQRMLDSKRLDKLDLIDKLEDEIEILKNRIEFIRKRT